MPQIINTNIPSLNAQRHLNTTQSQLSTALERLSSGKRINSAKDDAAGLGISSRMTTQVNGMNQAIRNARDGISLGQTAEGALSTSADMLQRIRTLAVQASNATNASMDRQAIQDEVNELTAELNRIATTTSFNGQKLLDGTMGAQNFQVGANAGEIITANGMNFQTNVYGNNRVYSKPPAAMTATTTLTDAAVKVSGSLGSSTVSFAGLSAKAAAAKVNAETNNTGVTAMAKTEVLAQGVASKSYSLDITSNNTTATTVSFTMGATLDADGYASAVNAINAVSAKTGVIAEYVTGVGGAAGSAGIKLTNQSGENIKIASANGTTPDATATFSMYTLQYDSATDVPALTGGGVNGNVAAGMQATGTVTFDSEKSFAITGGATDFASAAEASKLKAVSTLDVTTFDKAQIALATADAAINLINKEMARYGALQARFDATISNLEVNAENTTNARSRIMDADFAQETANLSRATILQQAGTAMLAQANQLPQNVLSLIR